MHQTDMQHHQLDQYQLQNHQMGLMNDQQAAYQWHHQQPTTDNQIMANQTYQLQSPNHSNYHQMSSPNQQMLMMQPPTQAQNQQHQQSHQPQMTMPGNNYIGQSQSLPVRANENASTSDDSDDNALNDPNVSAKAL